MEVFNNTINDFIVEYKGLLSNYDIHSFKDKLKNVNEASFLPEFDKALINPNMYKKYIDNILESMNRSDIDVEELQKFFVSICQASVLDSKNIAIHLYDESKIEKIRPEYLGSTSTEYQNVVKDILTDSIKIDEIKKNYVFGLYFDRLRKQLVKTSLEVNDIRNLMVLENPEVVGIDTVYIRNSIIPTLSTYKDSMKSLKIEAINLKGQINTTYQIIQDVNSSIRDMISENKLSAKNIQLFNYFHYNFLRNYMNCCAYITAMLIRKISIKMYNGMSYANLSRTITDYFPEGVLVLHENVLDGDLDDIDDNTLLNSMINDDLRVVLPHIHKVIGIKKMEISNMMANKFNYRLMYNYDFNSNEYKYDRTPYVLINRSILDIVTSMKSFSELMMKPDIIFDDIASESNLAEPFVSKYADVLTQIDNVDFYVKQAEEGLDKDDGSVTLSLFNDLAHFEENVATISNNINILYKYYDNFVSRTDTKPPYLDNNTYNECVELVKRLKVNLDEYALRITKMLLHRLDNLADCLKEANINNSDIQKEELDYPHDYNTDNYVDKLDNLATMEKSIFEKMLLEYNKSKSYNDKGITIKYEATEEVSGDDAKSSVTTSGGSSDNNPTNKNNGIIDRFIKWLKTIFAKFGKSSAELVEKNQQLIENAKSKVEKDDREYRIQLPKYEKFNEVTDSGLSKTASDISAIPSTIPESWKTDRKALESKYYPNIPATISNAESFSDRVVYYAYWGNNEKRVYVKYTGEDAKKKIREMIEYCEEYKDKSSSLSDRINDMGENLKKKIDSINGTPAKNNNQEDQNGEKEKPTNESVMYEAEGKDKTKEFVENYSAIFKDYSNAVMTATERQYVEYINIIRQLFPLNNDKKNDKNKSEKKNDESFNSNENAKDDTSSNSDKNTPYKNMDEFKKFISNKSTDVL